MSIHFACTLCGKCCRSMKLPLTTGEAEAWLLDDNELQVICEALPGAPEAVADDQRAAYRRRRAFAARSGQLSIQVVAILAANIGGACPHLQPDLRCGIYERRPLVCRIYPAEINPFRELQPAAKACPPEAWSQDRPLLRHHGELVDAHLRALIREYRDRDAQDAERRRRLCAALGLDHAAIADEGFVVYSPSRSQWRLALAASAEAHGTDAPTAPWRLVTNRRTTLADLTARAADIVARRAADALAEPAPAWEFLSFLADDL